MSINWVMLSRDGDVVRLPNETFSYKCRSRIALEIMGQRRPPGAAQFSVKSNEGTLYLTNQRVVYLPSNPTDQFKSFSAPILNFQDSFVDSHLLGAWFWRATVQAVPNGGIPTDFSRVDVKLTFKDGGHNEFRDKFERMKERLQHARDIGAPLGQYGHDEPLPQYEAAGSSSTGASAAGGSGVAAPTSATDTGANQPSQPPPNEPPPDYEEAQAQALEMRLDEHLRGQAERESR